MHRQAEVMGNKAAGQDQQQGRGCSWRAEAWAAGDLMSRTRKQSEGKRRLVRGLQTLKKREMRIKSLNWRMRKIGNFTRNLGIWEPNCLRITRTMDLETRLCEDAFMSIFIYNCGSVTWQQLTTTQPLAQSPKRRELETKKNLWACSHYSPTTSVLLTLLLEIVSNSNDSISRVTQKQKQKVFTTAIPSTTFSH